MSANSNLVPWKVCLSCLATFWWSVEKTETRRWMFSDFMGICMLFKWSKCFRKAFIAPLSRPDHLMVLDEKIYEISRILWSGPSISAMKHNASATEFSIHTPPMKSFKGIPREPWSMPGGCLSVG